MKKIERMVVSTKDVTGVEVGDDYPLKFWRSVKNYLNISESWFKFAIGIEGEYFHPDSVIFSRKVVKKAIFPHVFGALDFSPLKLPTTEIHDQLLESMIPPPSLSDLVLGNVTTNILEKCLKKGYLFFKHLIAFYYLYIASSLSTLDLITISSC